MSPESLAVGVCADTSITITFSEKIDRATFERALWMTPGESGKRKIDVSGERVTVTPEQGFPDSTTVGVLITTVLKDRRRGTDQNPLAAPYRWVFSTGDSIWPGKVSGKVEEKGRRGSQGQLLVAVFAPGDTIPDPTTVPPVAITEAGADGRYVIDGLPVDSVPRRLLAMMDRNGDREISGSGEYVSAAPETLLLTPAEPVREIAVALVDPEAPGEIRGSLVRAEGDTIDVWVEAFSAEGDSLAPAQARGKAAPDGGFVLQRVPPGKYRLIVFCDPDGSGTREPAEQAVSWGDLTLGAAETRDVGEWPVPGCSP